MIHIVQLQIGKSNPTMVDCELRKLEYLKSATLYNPIKDQLYALTWDGTQYSSIINRKKHIFALGDSREMHSKYITFEENITRAASKRTLRP